MPVSNEFSTIAVSEVKISDRVRKGDPNVEPLMESIQRLGLLHPIILLRDHTLVAGFRRYSAFKRLSSVAPEKFSKVPFQYLDELSAHEARAVELEENLKRVDLPWLDEANAIYELHELMKAGDPTWTFQQTADKVSLSPSHIDRHHTVIEAIRGPMPELAKASGLSAAYHALQRTKERKRDAAASLMDEIEKEIDHQVKVDVAASRGLPPPPPPKAEPIIDSVILGDFLTWAGAYEGPKFNLIHCDFPYGLEMGTANLQTSSQLYERYEDSEALYFLLLETLLKNLPRLATASAHILFWFSFKHWKETMARLEEDLPPDASVNPFPLIWFKSDGKGLLPDPQRGPRRVYETALLISLGDRKIVKPIANSYSCPTAKTSGVAEHLSEKPEPMLRHFFQLLVDGTTELLDPTCGSGTSLLAAESMGAKRVFGLDIRQDNVEIVSRRLANARRLRTTHLELEGV